MIKRVIIKVVMLVGLFTFLTGCSEAKQKAYDKESSIKFSTFTQYQRKEYVRDFLKQNYGLDCDISEVKQRQKTAVANEDFYYTTAFIADDKQISVWIGKNGEITDTVFLAEMQSVLTDYFALKIEDILSYYKMKTYTEMREMPTMKLETREAVEEFLREQPAYSYIRIFVDDSMNISEDILCELKDAFQGCEGKVYIYICEDIQEIDINEYDISKYSYEIEMKKG